MRVTFHIGDDRDPDHELVLELSSGDGTPLADVLANHLRAEGLDSTASRLTPDGLIELADGDIEPFARALTATLRQL